MRYQILHNRKWRCLELRFDGRLESQVVQQVQEVVTKLYEQGVSVPNASPWYKDTGQVYFDLIPFFRTHRGFAELRGRIDKALQALGYKPL